jgi:hypothetical protein
MTDEPTGRTETTSLQSRYAEQPNAPEVSGTSFPLLTTVLAGFAITIAVQLIIRPDATDELSARIIASIIAFLTSTLLFISSIIFSVNAQAHNYLPFLDIGRTGKRMFDVDDVEEWIAVMERRWEAFHLAAIVTFYGGILLLLLGVNLIVWELVGTVVALVFLGVITLNLILTTGVTLAVSRIRLPRETTHHATEVHPE